MIASNTSPAISLEKKVSPLLFSFFLRDCRSFPMRDGNFLFRFIRVAASLFEAPLLVLEFPENISAPDLQRALEYVLVLGLFVCSR